VASEYLFSRYPLNLLTVLFKSPLQIGRAERPKRSGPLFKCDTGDGAPDSALPVMSMKSDSLGKGGPKEIILKLNRTTHFIRLANRRM
jgi:hypothetical protein